MGAMFIGQQYLQNVQGYSTLEAGAAIIPAALAMVIVAPRSAKLVGGARRTVHAPPADTCSSCSGSLTMFLLWNEGEPYWQVALGYAFVGIGVGFAGTPASHSLTGSVPVSRAGMASGTADLQRDLGGAFMQSIFGALLTAGYAAAVVDGRSPARPERRPDHEQHPGGAHEVVLERRGRRRAVPAVRDGRSRPGPRPRSWTAPTEAYLAGIIAVLVGGSIVFLLFPKKADEERLLAEYNEEDSRLETGRGLRRSRRTSADPRGRGMGSGGVAMTRETAVAANQRTSGRRRVLSGFVLFLACLTILVTTVAVWTHQVALNTDPIHLPGQQRRHRARRHRPDRDAHHQPGRRRARCPGPPRGTPPGCDQAAGRFPGGGGRRADRRAAQDRPPAVACQTPSDPDGVLQPRPARPPATWRD